MYRFTLALAVAAMLSACGDSGDRNPGQEDDVNRPIDDGSNGGIAGAGENLAPGSLQQNLAAFAFSDDKSQVIVNMQSLDSTPLETVYQRNPNLDVAGYRAYSLQEDYLDRLFIALGAQSSDGDVTAAVASDGGQINRIQQGGYYTREGPFVPPEIGEGPGKGQVSYAGDYAGITNLVSSEGEELLPVPPGTNPTLIPDLPGQPGLVRGTMFLNANFADNSVNGEIYNRVFMNPIPGVADTEVENLALILTDIDENGEFLGDVENTDVLFQRRGGYGGIFGGEGATSVAGLISVSNHIAAFDSEIEVGVFVLTQCGQPDDAEICDGVAPN